MLTASSVAARMLTVAWVSALVLVAATGCTARVAESSATGAEASSTAPVVLQPGDPGDLAATLGPDAELPENEWNDSDVAFLEMMVPHHAQALELSALAPTRAYDGQVKSLARRISAAQGPEIIGMSAWLQARGLEVPRAEGDAHKHHHGGTPMLMPGMLSESEMRELAGARGARFDRLFLEGMIRHHEGAVQMADEVAVEGRDIQVSELAADVAVSQTAEIGRMRELLDGG